MSEALDTRTGEPAFEDENGWTERASFPATGVVPRSRRVARTVYGEISAMIFSATHRHLPRVLANSMPKAGTHLLVRLLMLLGFRHRGHLDIGPADGLQSISTRDTQQAHEFLSSIRSGYFSTSHFFFFAELANMIDQLSVKIVTIIRDPRDVCVSDVFHIINDPDHRLRPYYLEMDPDDRLMASIVGMESAELDGAPPSLDIGSHYRNYLGWGAQGGLVTKFEDLIGHRGGGDDSVQMQTVGKVVDYLGLELPRQELAGVCDKVFWREAKTFRKGQIGGWREHFGPEHVAAFDRVIGDVMQDFGYRE